MKKITVLIAFMMITLMSFSQTISEVRVDLTPDTTTGLNRTAIWSDFYIAAGLQSIVIDTNAQSLSVYYSRIILDNNGNPYKIEKVTVKLPKGSDGFNTFVKAYSAAFTPLIEAIIKENEGIE